MKKLGIQLAVSCSLGFAVCQGNTIHKVLQQQQAQLITFINVHRLG
ncbi:hypothetical protein SAMN05216480_110110 [Pustulibacterium marinum]|uniref:Uncharacterized protein n=1 Tax=Pustulibacterium marinum TaxID=1224947 RepID=A0A1I7HPV7_9FLAO|nr:hypothetical protein [Pustulibacterium marinum]SFU62691.1 hypothetical protein SAMN05216480_110110 [Pustulibacterium marinum]